MPKKKVEEVSPQVTKLPLPISDSPLVIDLPDGQKIVIGKMQTGSVIEVATWRGTGRPDSRTNRLMMGMNSGSAEVQEAPSAPAPAQAPKNVPAMLATVQEKISKSWKVLVQVVQQLINKVVSIAKNRKSEISTINNEETSTSLPLPPLSEVDEWLEAVLKKSQKKSARETEKQMQTSNAGGSKPAKKIATSRKTSSAKKKSAAQKRKK